MITPDLHKEVTSFPEEIYHHTIIDIDAVCSVKSTIENLLKASDREICLLAEPYVLRTFSEEGKKTLMNLLAMRIHSDSSPTLFVRLAALADQTMRTHLLLEFSKGLNKRDFEKNSYRKSKCERIISGLIEGILTDTSQTPLDQKVIDQADCQAYENLSQIASNILQEIKLVVVDPSHEWINELDYLKRILILEKALIKSSY